MSIFAAPYAAAYDLLYRSKDYAAECDFLERLFRRFAARPVRSVLDLGCGTAGHAIPLAARGYRVVGVDRSAAMLAAARAKARTAAGGAVFARGDVRTVRLHRRFDAVVSLFAVMGYQTGDDDFAAAADTAAVHLAPGGVFVFDVWHGPAVLRSPPGPRTRRARDGGREVLRRTRCSLDAARQVVSVRFSTRLREGGRAAARSEELHRVRYFFPRELELLVRAAGLVPAAVVPSLDERGTPDDTTWEVTVVATKPPGGRGAGRRCRSLGAGRPPGGERGRASR